MLKRMKKASIELELGNFDKFYEANRKYNEMNQKFDKSVNCIVNFISMKNNKNMHNSIFLKLIILLNIIKIQCNPSFL